MLMFPGYQLNEPVFQSQTIRLYRAIRLDDQCPVLFKTVNHPFPTAIDRANFRNEWDVARKMSGCEVLKPLALESFHQHIALVMEDFPGKPPQPDDFQGEGGLLRFLRLGVQLARFLAACHQEGFIHRNLKPNNILLDSSDGSFKVSGFLLTSLRKGLRRGLAGPGYDEELAYISPEQTMRLNQGVDYRTDFYSLGVVLYFWLTGRIPFDAEDPLGFIHSHLAIQPEEPNKFRGDLPEAVARIVMKLLNKTPADRYQSGYGLAKDLGQCLETVERGEVITPFPLGRKDVSPRLGMPQKLFGRQQEMAVLTRAFERVCLGGKTFLPVIGVTGMGKTGLVQELHRPVVRAGGFFASGRFESSRNPMPYQGLSMAFGDLVQQISTLKSELLAQWRSSLLEKLGAHGQIILDIIPDLEIIIGPQPPVPELGVVAAQNRLQWVFRDFVSLLTRGDRPLVLFLDDLHLADEGSLSLLGHLFADPKVDRLLVVGAYPPQYHLAGSRLKSWYDQLQDQKAVHSPLCLESMSPEHFSEMLSQLLRLPFEEVYDLGGLLARRSEGRPFYASMFLQRLHEQDLLRFDGTKGRWSWDMDALEDYAFSPDHIPDLVADRVGGLPEASQQLLLTAACIGFSFGLNLLASAHGHGRPAIVEHLKPAMDQNLIRPIGDAYALFEVLDPSEWTADMDPDLVVFQFAHVHIHQAVYAIMDEEQSHEVHLLLGQKILEERELPELGLFKIVNQLNAGMEKIDSETERRQLAELNHKAARAAAKAVAYQRACTYYRVALQLLEEISDDDPEMLLALRLDLAEAMSLDGAFEEAHRLMSGLFDAAPDIRTKAKVILRHLGMLHNHSRLGEAVSLGLQGLALFDAEVPRDAKALKEKVEREIPEWLAAFREFDPMTLPLAEDETQIPELMALLVFLTPPTFNTDQALFKLIVLEQVRYVQQKGLGPWAAHAFAVLGVVMNMYGHRKAGFRLGQAALELNQKFPHPQMHYKPSFICCNLLNHWARPLGENLPNLERVIVDALGLGDWVYANYASLVALQHQWVLGEPLPSVLERCERRIRFAQRTGNTAMMDTKSAFRSAILNLKGRTDQSDSFAHGEFNEEQVPKDLAASGYLTGLSVYYILRLQVFFLRGHYDRALEAAEKAASLVSFNEGTLMMTVYGMYRALTLIACFDRLTDRDQAQADLRAHWDQFREWADLCPENFSAAYDLIGAEIAKLERRDQDAQRAYHRALHHVETQPNPQMEGLIHELTARFHLDRGFPVYAAQHFQGAMTAFTGWGAAAKVADLERDFAKVLDLGHGGFHTQLFREPDQGQAYSRALDLTTLMKSAQTITSEFHLDRLMEKLMTLILENAGARWCVLMLQHQDDLMAEATGCVEKGTRLLGGVALDKVPRMAQAVVNHVVRSRSEVRIDDGSLSLPEDAAFRSDPYFVSQRVRSLLCLPILRGADLIGVLYLENELTTGAFKRERVELLHLLAPQIAISLENARYVSRMRELNRTLQKEIQAKNRAELSLEKAQRLALANAHKAARVEFANSVLHNINNILNSARLSCQTVRETNRTSRIEQLQKLILLLNTQSGDLGQFFTQDPKGKLVPEYLTQLGEVLTEESGIISEEMDELQKNLDLMRDIVEKQQEDAKHAINGGEARLILLVEDALKLQREIIQKHEVEVLRQYDTEESVQAKTSEVTHILINLIKNAVEAMETCSRRQLTIATFKEGQDRVCLTVGDTGTGIKPEDLSHMFSHGFTTKASGHGFGLHYCAKTMEEMGGQIEVSSDGPGQGASFTLRFQALGPLVDS